MAWYLVHMVDVRPGSTKIDHVLLAYRITSAIHSAPSYSLGRRNLHFRSLDCLSPILGAVEGM